MEELETGLGCNFQLAGQSIESKRHTALEAIGPSHEGTPTLPVLRGSNSMLRLLADFDRAAVEGEDDHDRDSS